MFSTHSWLHSSMQKSDFGCSYITVQTNFKTRNFSFVFYFTHSFCKCNKDDFYSDFCYIDDISLENVQLGTALHNDRERVSFTVVGILSARSPTQSEQVGNINLAQLMISHCAQSLFEKHFCHRPQKKHKRRLFEVLAIVLS